MYQWSGIYSLNNKNKDMSKKADKKDSSTYRLRSQKRTAGVMPLATGEKVTVKAPQTSKMEQTRYGLTTIIPQRGPGKD